MFSFVFLIDLISLVSVVQVGASECCTYAQSILQLGVRLSNTETSGFFPQDFLPHTLAYELLQNSCYLFIFWSTESLADHATMRHGPVVHNHGPLACCTQLWAIGLLYTTMGHWPVVHNHGPLACGTQPRAMGLLYTTMGHWPVVHNHGPLACCTQPWAIGLLYTMLQWMQCAYWTHTIQ